MTVPMSRADVADGVRTLDCLIVFPADSDRDAICPRCKERAGAHPAALSLVEHIDPEHPVHGRPTFDEAGGRTDVLS